MLNINIPSTRIAAEPPEERGVSRDRTRLMISYKSNKDLIHTRFFQIMDFLSSGDLLVINTSATIPTCFSVKSKKGFKFELRLSQKIMFDLWLAELNVKDGDFSYFKSGDPIELPNGATCLLHMLCKTNCNKDSQLWVVSIITNQDQDILHYLANYVHPYHFNYHAKRWPLSYYQNVYATEPGSAEMPCAGRGFTPELISRLVSKGVGFVPLVLHAGTYNVGSIPPEYYRIPLETARAINNAHAVKKRVIAVGTTVIRALQTVADTEGQIYPGQGWTQLRIKPDCNIKSVDGLLTGLHEPEASHIDMLLNFTNREQLEYAYNEALLQGYLWHEFGDFHLMLP
jgi:S-adenosylmethionine:tRNA ribosyltransferase-isomerase